MSILIRSYIIALYVDGKSLLTYPPILRYNRIMTHEELLAQIEGLTVIDGIFMKDVLVALLEYHEPFDFTFGGETETACYCGEMYPCPTIQIIIRELE